MSGIEGQDRAQRAEVLAQAASACRQAGAMMEAGVDILAITRVLRSQSEDEDILRLCDRIDFDLKQGRAISEAMADERDLFSPFMVTLVRQGEERNTLPQAFARVAQALESERQELLQAPSPKAARATEAPTPRGSASTSHMEERGWAPQVLEGAAHEAGALSAHAQARFDVRSWPELSPGIERVGARWLRTASSLGAALLAASAAGEALGALGLVSPRWQRPLARALSAGVLALAASRARKAQDAIEEAQSSRAQREPLPEPPQALEAALEAQAEPRDQDRATEERRAQPVHDGRARAKQLAEQEEAPRTNSIYSGAPREDEEEEPRRQVRRPRQEEEFD